MTDVDDIKYWWWRWHFSDDDDETVKKSIDDDWLMMTLKHWWWHWWWQLWWLRHWWWWRYCGWWRADGVKMPGDCWWEKWWWPGDDVDDEVMMIQYWRPDVIYDRKLTVLTCNDDGIIADVPVPAVGGWKALKNLPTVLTDIMATVTVMTDCVKWLVLYYLLVLMMTVTAGRSDWRAAQPVEKLMAKQYDGVYWLASSTVTVRNWYRTVMTYWKPATKKPCQWLCSWLLLMQAMTKKLTIYCGNWLID